MANKILETAGEPYVAITKGAGTEKMSKLLSAEGRGGRTTQKPRPRDPKNGVHLDSLLDAPHRALSLNALARSATLSGKRLVIEVRDLHPVKIIRHGNV